MLRGAVRAVCGVVVCAGAAQAQVPISRVNVTTDGTPIPALQILGAPRSDRDGARVVFSSGGALFPQTRDDQPEIYLRHLGNSTTTRLSVGPNGEQADGSSFYPAISADGRFVAFNTYAYNLEAPRRPTCGFPESCTALYLYDGQTGTIERVARGIGGSEPNGASYAPYVSGDGRFVAFESSASNLVSGDTNQVRDVFVWDRVTRTTARVNVASDGTQALSDAGSHGAVAHPVVSDDGRWVAFISTSSNLAPGGPNVACQPHAPQTCQEAYLHDRQTGRTVRVSVSSAGVRSDRGAVSLAMTPDARTVVFTSGATNLGGMTNPTADFGTIPSVLYAHDTATGVTTPAYTWPSATPLFVSDVSISAEGRFVAFISSGSGLPDGSTTPPYVAAMLWDRELRSVRSIVAGAQGEALPPNHSLAHAFLSADHHALTFMTAAVAGLFLDPQVLQLDPLDGDRDGMSNTWEEALGLDPRSSAGLDGATGDPDGDDSTNLDEFTAQTHPRGLPAATRYFAEGATGPFFETRIALANPSQTTARALLRMVDGNGHATSTTVAIPARQSRKVSLGQVPRLGGSEFATTVESDVALVAERQMWWSTSNAYGSHAERALTGPATTWYFAEGATTGGFDLFYLLQNPGATAATVDVTYLRATGAAMTKTYSVPAHARTNIWVDVETFDGVAALAAAEVSAVIDVRDGPGIIAERAMYYSAPGAIAPRPFDAGHEAAGITAPALSWFLAEGATGSYFDLFVLIGNPSGTPAAIDAEYLLPDGTRIVRAHVVPARSRYSIWVDHDDPGLADTAVSTTIRVTNGVAVVVERAMWWPGPTSADWLEAHASAGSVVTAARWAVADGVVADAPGRTDTYVLVANTGVSASEVRVTLLYDNGAPEVSRTFMVGGGSRYNVDVRAEFPAAVGRGFGVLVESLSGAPLVVERSIYNDAGGARWAAGNNAPGTPQP
jgi:hypothetical protein